MRIAYFADNFYPEISGISDSIITTGEELRKRGHEVVYVAPWYGKKEFKPARRYDEHKKLIHDIREDLPVRRVPSLPFPNSPTGQSRIAMPFGFTLPFMRRFKPDIIHSQAPHGVGLEALYAALALDVPLVGTEHTPVEEFFHYSPAVAATFGAQWLRWERWYYNRCRFVTAPYQGLIDEMRKRGLRAEGRAQANPVPFESIVSTAEQKAACRSAFDMKGPVILVSGRLAPEKKVDIVLRAFAQVLAEFPDATLVVTGHGSSERSLKNLAKGLQIDKNVQFVGFVNAAALQQLYCTADVYAIMSTAETQSLSLMQGFASGVPAVCARARGLVEYCPSDCGFLVEPDNVGALAEKLKLVLEDHDLRARMGARGVEFVKRFTPEKVAEQWEEIYKSVIL
ncbi:MAG: glycosyltransferase [Patescibacteria group bacterium]|nr:glycosyltransferase [Patescibacteria group bacterium]